MSSRTPGRVDDWGKIIPTPDHPPGGILMGGSTHGERGAPCNGRAGKIPTDATSQDLPFNQKSGQLAGDPNATSGDALE